ncbi:phosphatase PAP2 family protein [Natronomonas salina]|uniref:phosphatase PAP2 family protein n=1 Tax=Natronomonas salina TaxID=1710540 RepID=UPI0015B6B6E4|nr:phosphatase PAP2 family protein [Natronomonas salina]QLD89007.1 phosphatase PAP2 family protein [Natronomonas salina]
MVRGFGEAELVAEAPTVLVVLAALVTQLGDVWFLFALLGLCYWFGETLPGPLSFDRPTAAFLIALGLGAKALTTTLKQWLAYPRPPAAGEAVGTDLLPALLREGYVSAATATGFGFPSGHATGAIAVYGGLALAVNTRRAYAAAVAVVPLIALSRVVLGVHYAVDILVGLALGGTYLVTVWRLCDRGTNAGRAFTAALLVGLVGAAVTYNFETMASLGGVLGARIAWGVVGDAIVHGETTRTGGAVAAAVGAVFGGLFGVVYEFHVEPYLAFLGVAVVLGGVIAAPLLGEATARRLPRRSAAGTSTGD